MSALSLRLPESLHRKVRELAEREDISINQFIATAVAELRAAMTPNGRCTSQGRFGSSGSAAAFDECPCRMLAGEDCTVGGV